MMLDGAQHKLSKISYTKAKRNLAYAYIKSPINGVIIAKEVEEGHDMDAYADPELDYEGAMAKNQLARIMLHADHLSQMLDDNENMPEWVQSKITKALDYVATAHDYLMGEEYKD